MLAPPRGVGAPSSGKSWIRHCQGTWPIWVTLSPLYARQWRVYIVKFWMRALPLGPIFFIFIQFMAKFGPIIGWNPPPSRKSWIRCYGVMSHQCDSSLLDIYVSVLHSENVTNKHVDFEIYNANAPISG